MKKGSNGKEVAEAQRKLKKVLNKNLSIDGDFGPVTEKAVKEFQRRFGLTADGIIGRRTSAKLNSIYRKMFVNNSPVLNLGSPRFVVFADAGHGGLNDAGEYVTPGKRAFHEGTSGHVNGHYFEGYENRIVSERFIELCANNGVMCVRTYHPEKDTPLRERAELVRSFLRRGYYGYLHSFHSNAISLNNSAERLLKTIGFGVYTTRKNNISDLIAERHFQETKETFPNWKFRPEYNDGDSDRERNFYILKNTDLEDFEFKFGSILEEFGFHTSKADVSFITNPETREKRAVCALKTALFAKQLIEDRLKEAF